MLEKENELGDKSIIDVVVIPPERQLAPPDGEILTPPKNKGGRPPGRKTSPDAPSMVAKREKIVAEAETKGEAIPDNLLFVGGAEIPPNEPPKDFIPTDAENPGDESKTETPPPTDSGETHRPLATMIWDSVVIIMATLLGDFWHPRKKGDNLNAGEIPYDERTMVIDAFCEYFASIGMILLTPVQKLWMAISAYSIPRVMPSIGVIKEWLKKRKAASVPKETAGDARMPKKENEPPKTANPDKTELPKTSAPFADTLAGH